MRDLEGNTMAQEQVNYGGTFSAYFTPGEYKVYVTDANSEYAERVEVFEGQTTTVKASSNSHLVSPSPICKGR